MKAQGSLEYLLILAAILAISAVVVIVANTMLAPGQASSSVTSDKYAASLKGIELVGYSQVYDGVSNYPVKITYKNAQYGNPYLSGVDTSKMKKYEETVVSMGSDPNTKEKFELALYEDQNGKRAFLLQSSQTKTSAITGFVIGKGGGVVVGGDKGDIGDIGDIGIKPPIIQKYPAYYVYKQIR
ncbi:MAG: class III signal peptide-containing protein [Candidatus Diapherotrites archaeon]|nr:class III signal peptide-containing protein [Candidatus Diapherotrites archaeon]